MNQIKEITEVLKDVLRKECNMPKSIDYTEWDKVDVYEIVFSEDHIVWFEELAEIKERIENSTEFRPLACIGVGSTAFGQDDIGEPLLRIEIYKDEYLNPAKL